MRASIIIPAYNARDRLDLNLKALNEQTWEGSDVEVIVIDNGSTDNTMSVLKNVRLKYPLKIIRLEENKGIAYARNAGIYESTGDVLIFHDSDMIASKDFIKLHLELHKEPGIVVCGLFWRRIFTFFYRGFNEYQLMQFEKVMKEKGLYQDKPYKNASPVIPIEKVTAEDLMQYSFDLDFGFIEDLKAIVRKHGNNLDDYFLPWRFFITNNVSVDRKNVIEVGMFDNNIVRYGYEDYDLGVRLYKSGCRFVMADHIVSLHQEHPGNYQPDDLFININYMCDKYNNIYFIDVPLVCLSDSLNIDKTNLNNITREIYKLLPHKEYHDILQLFLNLLQVMRKRTFGCDDNSKAVLTEIASTLGDYARKTAEMSKKENVPHFVKQLCNLFKEALDIDFEKMMKNCEERRQSLE
ncbi:MAG: glycosyltransferase family 2 protein [Clostridiaceae bacterium]|nr:glycosyltransferase family 2 protein [Clostridiaceae bacterium]